MSAIRATLLAALLAIAPEHAGANPPDSWLVGRSVVLAGAPAAVTLDAIALDAQGNSVVTGISHTTRYPGIDSARTLNGGSGFRFVARFDATGAQRGVAVVGSPGDDAAFHAGNPFRGLALDSGGNAYVVAYDVHHDFPITGGRYRAPSARPYVFRVSPLGAVTRYVAPLDASILTLGGLAADAAGNVYVAGSAAAGLSTTAGAPYSAAAVAAICVAPFVAKLDASSPGPVYATYLGFAGTQGEPCGNHFPAGPLDPAAFAVAVDGAGNAYVTGQAEPGVRATIGAPDQAPKAPTLFQGGRYAASHAFLSKVNAAGTAIPWSIRLGGSNRERGTAVLIDAAGNVYLAGKTTSSDFPSYGSVLFRPFVSYTCLLDTPEFGFIAKLAADGSRVMWSGLLPGAGNDIDDCGGSQSAPSPVVLAFTGAGTVIATGYSQPSNRTVHLSVNALQSVDGDAFYTEIDGSGAVVYATWLSLRGHPVGIGVDADGNARIAGGGFLHHLSRGRLPIEVTSRIDPACADQPVLLEAAVAGSGNLGNVSFRIDGVASGVAGLHAGVAPLALPLAPGVHRVDASYSGATPFDGYDAPPLFLRVNLPGACL